MATGSREDPSNFLTVCVNPTLQRTLTLPTVTLGEVNRATRHRLDASGKGINVSRVLAQLGAPVLHLCQAGGDSRELFLSLARADHIDVRYAETEADIRTCYTLLGESPPSTTEVVEEGRVISPSTETALREMFTRLLPSCHTVVISGSKAPGFSPQFFPNLVKEAKASGALVIIDYRGADLVNSIDHRPDIIKPNFSEFAETFCGRKPGSEASADPLLQKDIEKEMLRLLREKGITSIVTHGHLPTLWIDTDGVIHEAVPTLVKPVNTIGCGDVFTAGLAYTLHQQNWLHLSTPAEKTAAMQAAIQHAQICASKNAMLERPGVIF
ncbi:tagatose-6-phosphate kinase [Pelomyxa schiedti]|nr:tagatose-6-phosphate kinase [Pelomyxa schiedti]